MEDPQHNTYFKSGDRGSVANYRPISLLSCASKVLERLVYNKLMDYLEQHISPAQFGFLKNHSTQQQLLLFYHHILGHKSASSQWDLIFLDFSKAFDSVSHSELLLKMKHGMRGDLCTYDLEIPIRRCSQSNLACHKEASLAPSFSSVC